jgi:hypothetical protein
MSHGFEWLSGSGPLIQSLYFFKKKSLQPSTHCRAVTKGNVAFGMWGLPTDVRS